MPNGTIKTQGHTSIEGTLGLHLEVGLADADVEVVVHVKPLPTATEFADNGWPKDFFEKVAGSMPELRRWKQGQFEDRLAFE